MNDIFNQLRFGMEVAWSRIRYEASNNVTLVVAAVAIILLAWLCLAPAVRKKSS